MQLSHDTFLKLTQLIQQWTGLALGPDKAYLVRHRLAPIVRSCGFAGFDDLLLRLQAGGAMRIQDAVVEAITTKETSFFRDEWFFDTLLKLVLPAISSTGDRGRLRIWSAGTSTGQEAYSLAMVLRELTDATGQRVPEDAPPILATDISTEAIEAAKIGLYSQQEVERGLSEARLRRYFKPHDRAWRAGDSLRKLVQFRTFNLIGSSAELGGFDLILCRNVLIYFDLPTRTRVCDNLRRALRPGGWLAVGSAESLHGISGDLETVRFDRAFLYQCPSMK